MLPLAVGPGLHRPDRSAVSPGDVGAPPARGLAAIVAVGLVNTAASRDLRFVPFRF